MLNNLNLKFENIYCCKNRIYLNSNFSLVSNKLQLNQT